jgi:hypothetical protein
MPTPWSDGRDGVREGLGGLEPGGVEGPAEVARACSPRRERVRGGAAGVDTGVGGRELGPRALSRLEELLVAPARKRRRASAMRSSSSSTCSARPGSASSEARNDRSATAVSPRRTSASRSSSAASSSSGATPAHAGERALRRRREPRRALALLGR